MIGTRLLRNLAATLAAIAAFGLLLCLPLRAALAETEIPDGGSLGAFIGQDTAFVVKSGSVAGCDIPAGVTVTIAGGTLDMDGFLNAGTITVAGGALSGRIYNAGAIAGGSGYSELVPGSAVSGAGTVVFSDGGYAAADYKGGILWIPKGTSIAYLIINDYVCQPNGERVVCSISYRYRNADSSPMSLDAKTFPASYHPRFNASPLTIPKAPDTEVDYVFSGWACDALGVDETNMQTTFTIPAGTIGNLTLVSCWTFQNGHNENLGNATTGMTSGGTVGGTGSGASGSTGGASGGVGGALSAILGAEDSAASDADTDTSLAADDTVTNLLTGSQGGMRVRNASSVTRHAFTGEADDIEARASARQQKRFPWQWVGAGAGGALLLFAAGLTIRRRLRARNAATLEKLRIYD